ncbi:HAMP domain-containing sensor histidine kinase [Undibacterium sp. SXout7W]|uniref:HAMP domain-containing sensor histidine kinase n=1 Tax=Undibacterium sp. SXout7W TaxID=3413049 RepID=UPI003BF07E43
MGRLFWKFFFFIWLAQLTAIFGISGTLWLKHRNELVAEAALGDAEKLASDTVREHRRPPHSHEEGAGLFPEGHAQHEPHEPHEPHDLHGTNPPHRHDKGPDGHDLHAFLPLIAGFFASLVFAALMAWYMAHPIRRLRDVFHQIASGDLQARVGQTMGKRRDELSDLGQDFDRMAEQLTGSIHSQRRLLHDVSHELRSPLARLQAAIGLARQQPERAETYMQRMELEANRMDKLVGELLTLSRLEAGAGIGMDIIHVDELLGELVDNISFEAGTSGKRFEAQCDLQALSDVTIQGRYELLYRACENVLRNAIRYTLPDTRVTLTAEKRDTRLMVTVMDEGPGVPEQELGMIFDAFYRGHQNQQHSQNSEGYGLGLAIAQRVILAHGGSISASNRHAGGLCVYIVLPVATGLC